MLLGSAAVVSDGSAGAESGGFAGGWPLMLLGSAAVVSDGSAGAGSGGFAGGWPLMLHDSAAAVTMAGSAAVVVEENVACCVAVEW